MTKFDIVVHYGGNVIEFSECDADYVSMIALLHAFNRLISGESGSPTDEYSISVQLSCSGMRVEVNSESDMLETLNLFSKKKQKRIALDRLCALLFQFLGAVCYVLFFNSKLEGLYV